MIPAVRFSSVVSFPAVIALTACAASPAASPATSNAGAPTDGSDATAQAEPAPARDAASEPSALLGGRLFDKWFKDESYAGDFSPASEGTPGKGGPGGDGRLNNASGKPLDNTGHDYRLKNFFGWDLRGAEGIYGPDYHAKSYAVPHNLLTDTRSAEEIAAWLSAGDEQLPAMGSVLSAEQVRAIAEFVVAVRDKTIPGPADVFRLSKDAPKNYELLEGGNAENGKRFISAECSSCHGDDGRELPIDETYSLGAYSRIKAYEAWLKVVVGHPGSEMGPQLPSDASYEEQAQLLRDIFAALCDRQTFPAIDGQGDVEVGDARCGAYLK